MSEFRRRLMMQNKAENPILKDYLTIVALEDGLTAKLSVNACEYCVDGDGNWMVLPADTETETVNSGQTLSFRGNITPNYNNGIGTFTINKFHNLKGNCMSMLFGDNTKDKQTLQGYAFKQLFAGCDKLLNAKEMVLSVKSLGYESCNSMFRDCKNLITTPKLLAKVLSGYCYRDMFNGCSSLIIAPELPATVLYASCYFNMFRGCTSLRTAPKLPATVLVSSCYSNMFNGCTSLRTAPELPATTLADYCYFNMFRGCTSLTTSPELPATTLADYCYWDMFNGCNNLNYIKMLAIDISATLCMSTWASGVASSGTFVKNKDATWDVRGVSGIPNGWEVITE